MNGAEHYREAEQLLHDCGFDSAERAQDLAHDGGDLDKVYLAAAQAHFLGAIAAAKVPPSYTMKLSKPADDTAEPPDDPPVDALVIAGIVFEVGKDGGFLTLRDRTAGEDPDNAGPAWRFTAHHFRSLAAWLNAHAEAADDDTMPCGCSSGSCYCEPKGEW